MGQPACIRTDCALVCRGGFPTTGSGALALSFGMAASREQLAAAAERRQRSGPGVTTEPLPKRPKPLLRARLERAGLSDDAVPKHFVCAVSLQLFEDPVMAADGNTYEREAITAWLARGRHTSPITNEDLPSLSLTPNHILRSMVVEWVDQVAGTASGATAAEEAASGDECEIVGEVTRAQRTANARSQAVDVDDFDPEGVAPFVAAFVTAASTGAPSRWRLSALSDRTAVPRCAVRVRQTRRYGSLGYLSRAHHRCQCHRRLRRQCRPRR